MLDKLVSPDCSQEKKLLRLIKPAFKSIFPECDGGIEECINRPMDIDDAVGNTTDKWWGSIIEQSFRPYVDRNDWGAVRGQLHRRQALVDVHALLQDCDAVFCERDASDCTTLEVQGQQGGT